MFVMFSGVCFRSSDSCRGFDDWTSVVLDHRSQEWTFGAEYVIQFSFSVDVAQHSLTERSQTSLLVFSVSC